MKPLLGTLALVVGSVCFALAVAEAGLRMLDWYPPPPVLVEPLNPELYTADPDVGYRMHANLRTTYRYPLPQSDPIPLSANSSGFRDARDFGEQNGRPRVLVVGDSFVFGEGVRAEDRLTEVLESLRPDWQVDNLGMPGWGLDLMIRALERYVDVVQPAMVVLCVYTDDFRRLMPYYAGAGFTYPRFELEGGDLVTVPPKRPTGLAGTRIGHAWFTWYWAGRQNRYELNGALLDRFLENAERHGFVPVTLFLPGRDDTEIDRERRGFLEQWSTANGVTHRDLTDPIHSAGVDRVYIERNFHWNRAGHRIAAKEIAKLLPSGAAPDGATTVSP